MFTLPAAVADIAYHQKATVYDVLFKASAETLIAIAADPRQLSARIGVMSVLHTWGSALTHHPPSPHSASSSYPHRQTAPTAQHWQWRAPSSSSPAATQERACTKQ